MRKLKQGISLLTTICMLFSMVPTLSAPAAAAEPPAGMINIMDYDGTSTYATVPEDFAGTIFKLIEIDKNARRYAMEISAYNMPDGIAYYAHRLKVDPNVAVLTNANGEEIYDPVEAIEYSLIDKRLASKDRPTGLDNRNIIDTRGLLAADPTDGVVADGTVGVNLIACFTEPEISTRYGFYGNGLPHPNNDIITNDGIYYPKNQPYKLVRIHFQMKGEKNIDSNTLSYWGVFPGNKDATQDGGCTLGTGEEGIVNQTSIKIGWPEPEAPSTTITGITVNDSAAAAFTDTKATVEFDGKTFNINSSGQLVVGANAVLDLKLALGEHTYTIKPSVATHVETKGTVTVAEGATSLVFTVNKKVAGQTDVLIKVVDGDNANTPITDATLAFDGSTLTYDSAAGAYKKSGINTAFTSLTLATAQNGYTSVAADTKVSRSEAGVYSSTAANVKDQVIDGKNYLVVTMSKVVNTIKIPIKAAGTMTIGDAKKLTLTLSKNPDGKTPDTLALPIDINSTPKENGSIIINGGTTTTADTDAVTSLVAEVKVPAGNYMIALGGTGLDGTTEKLNVVATTGSGAIALANLGGDVSGGTVSGGFTTTTPKTITNVGAEFDLAALNVTSGGSLDQSTGAVTGGTDNAGGVPADDQPEVAVIMDPVYFVDVVENKTGGVVTSMTASVYLKNVQGAMGTFGLRWDANIFNTAGVVFNTDTANEVKISSKLSGLDNPEIGTNYHTFSWEKTGTNALDARTEQKLIGTYTLPVKDGVDLNKVFDNQSIYVMDYSQTKNAGKILGGTRVEQWRKLGEAGSAPSDGTHPHKALDNKYATAGGFYQLGYDAGFYDIRTQFTLPNNAYGNIRVNFGIKDKETSGNPVSGANIMVYSADDALVDTVPDAAKMVASATSGTDGSAYVTVKPNKTYKFNITSTSHWDFPDGTPSNPGDVAVHILKVTTDSENVITNDGTADKDWAATAGVISPVMQARAYHKVLVNATGVTAGAPTLASLDQAYNQTDLFFTLDPASGYKWNSGKPAAGTKLVVNLYGVGGTNAAPEYEFGTPTALEAVWDVNTNSFKVAGTGITGDPNSAIDPRRAGDVSIVIDQDFVDGNFVQSQMGIVATASEGGTIKVDTVAEGSTFADASGTEITNPKNGTSYIKETMKQGNVTPSSYTITPNPNTATELYSIDKILVNGTPIALTEYQSANGYTYEFTGANASQTIHATFVKRVVDADGSIKDPEPVGGTSVSVNVGDFGTVAPTLTKHGETAETTETVLTGPARAIYEAKASSTLKLLITPVTDYEVDRVIVDGVEQTVTAAGYTQNVTMDAAGKTHSVVVTFKKIGGPSIQVAVEAKLGVGMGSISNYGITIYNINATPTYVVTPSGEWQKYTATLPTDATKGIEVKVGSIIKDASGSWVDGTKTYSYTLSPIKENTEVIANFSEIVGEIIGSVLFSDGTNNFSNGGKATVTFNRPADPTTGADAVEITTETEVLRTNGVAAFTAKVPKGTWSVTVEKSGYLDYVITGFERTTVDKVYLGDKAGQNVAKPIPLVIGDATADGKVISFADAAQVQSGFLESSDYSKAKGDIDESSFGNQRTTGVEDMAYVKQNYNKEFVTKKYEDFIK